MDGCFRATRPLSSSSYNFLCERLVCLNSLRASWSARIEISDGCFRREKLFLPGAALEQAGAGLEKIVVGSLRRVPPGEAPSLAWPLVCGSVVAERTRALEFADAVLRVEVPDAGWKREMQALAPRYLAALNRYAGQKVERIEFVIRQS
jgi:hypothetical protein